MNARFWIAVVVIFVLSMAIGMLVHGMLLHEDYSQLPNLLRTEEDGQRHFGWMILAHALMAFAFTWIYTKGREPNKGPLEQGLRYGAAVALLVTIPTYLIYYAVQPWPGAVVVKSIVFDTIGMLMMGAAVGLVAAPPHSKA